MPPLPSDRLAGIYDYRLVALSVLISVLASSLRWTSAVE
jgi:hypothetical protein